MKYPLSFLNSFPSVDIGGTWKAFKHWPWSCNRLLNCQQLKSIELIGRFVFVYILFFTFSTNFDERLAKSSQETLFWSESHNISFRTQVGQDYKVPSNYSQILQSTGSSGTINQSDWYHVINKIDTNCVNELLKKYPHVDQTNIISQINKGTSEKNERCMLMYINQEITIWFVSITNFLNCKHLENYCSWCVLTINNGFQHTKIQK